MEDNVTITRKEYIHLLNCKLALFKLYSKDDTLYATTELAIHLNDVKALAHENIHTTQ